MSPRAGEGCWAPAGRPRFLEDPASLLGRQSFVTTLITANAPATVSAVSRHPSLSSSQLPSLFPARSGHAITSHFIPSTSHGCH